MQTVIVSKNYSETMSLGENLGKLINENICVVFSGGLGAGKTCFTVGLCKGLDYNGDVTSPTFAIINEYLGGRLPIYHFDMYRINGIDGLYSIDFYDYLDNDGVKVIEWSENMGDIDFGNKINVDIEAIDDLTRKITVTASEKIIKGLLKNESSCN